jgi:hypothetical protein
MIVFAIYFLICKKNIPKNMNSRVVTTTMSSIAII